jgi:hypothetical protein
LIENHNSEHAGKKKENFHSSIDSQTAGWIRMSYKILPFPSSYRYMAGMSTEKLLSYTKYKRWLTKW